MESPRDLFLRKFPSGFSDPEYFRLERDYKWSAHQLWVELLNCDELGRLLDEGLFEEICRRAFRVVSKTRSMLSLPERMALRDGVQHESTQALFANALFDLIYGDHNFQTRFEEFCEDLGRLQQPQTSPLKWPVATVFPFVADPTTHIFLKPKVSQSAAARRGFHLEYRTIPNWSTYDSFLRLAMLIREEIAELSPRDTIDVQSYIWVTERGHEFMK